VVLLVDARAVLAKEFLPERSCCRDLQEIWTEKCDSLEWPSPRGEEPGCVPEKEKSDNVVILTPYTHDVAAKYTS